MSSPIHSAVKAKEYTPLVTSQQQQPSDLHKISYYTQQQPPQDQRMEGISVLTSGKYLFGVGLSVTSHILFGLQHTFSRYLQHDVKKPIPTLSLLVTSNLLALLLYLPALIPVLLRKWRERQVIQEENEPALLGQFEKDETVPRASVRERTVSLLKRYASLIIFIVSIIARSGTNLYSTKFTTAINVQLVSLFTPFIVSALTLCVANRFLHENQRETINVRSLAAVVVTVIGGAMIIVGGSVYKYPDRKWYDFIFTLEINWRGLSYHLTWRDGVGMVLTFVSSASLGIYMIALRFMKKTKSTSGFQLSEGNLFIVQQVTVVVTFIIPSIVLEDWSAWKYLSTKGYIIFVLFAVLVYLAARTLNIYSIQLLGAAITGSLLALRLVSTMFFGEIFLNERLKSFWQVFGSVIVMLSVSYFMYSQNRVRARAERRARRGKKLPIVIERERKRRISSDFASDIPEHVNILPHKKKTSRRETS